MNVTKIWLKSLFFRGASWNPQILVTFRSIDNLDRLPHNDATARFECLASVVSLSEVICSEYSSSKGSAPLTQMHSCPLSNLSWRKTARHVYFLIFEIVG
jgi:hypothetical protein